MSKRNIQDLARILASKYDEANVALEEAGHALVDTMLSPQEQEIFASKKAVVDNMLSTLSVGLSAAAQGKIDELLKQVTAEYTAFAEPLCNLIDNLADQSMPLEQREASEQLVKAYNDKIRAIDVILSQLKIIKFYANLVSNKKKQLKFFRDKFCCGCEQKLEGCKSLSAYCSLEMRRQAAYVCYSPFRQLDEALCMLKEYISQLSATTQETQIDDLSE